MLVFYWDFLFSARWWI